ncbi:MAG: TIR domain-containing protein, partial [Cyanobacteriota bacterium]|nr:TIR domain-containing protein [Cyanobacteriota bacterium]
MTQVFLSYADEDRETMEKIRNSLRRESFTVWTNTTDIQTGEAFEEAIKRGIEQADNVVYLLSPDSVKSYFTQRELDYALSLNKRIIPILVRETPSELIPNELQALHYIDLTDNVKEEDYHLDESQLLGILNRDAAYYNEHKILLTKALKWKHQHDNPSILLRGYNLRSAEAWLKTANKRTQHQPTALIEEFIVASLRQPPVTSLDVFISYSRADSDLARKLNEELQLQGKTTWFDQESIASGMDFKREIYRGIQACDNFLFVLSPRSINSPYCKDEVEYAARLNKRFVTVLYRKVNPEELHSELAKVQWIDFNRNEQDFQANFRQLVRTLDTDREHLRSHTKWSQRAIEWQEKGKSDDLLLRGSEFAVAENWLLEAEQNKKKPAFTPLQQEYICQSREVIEAGIKQQKRRVIILRSLLGLMSAGFVIALGTGGWALHQKKQAEENLISQVKALTRYSKTLNDSKQEFDALIEGIRAGASLEEKSDDLFDRFGNKDKYETVESEVEKALWRALFDVKELNRIEAQKSVEVSPDKQTIATIAEDGKVRLWDFQGKEKTPQPLAREEKITDIYFTQDGKEIATVSGEGEKRTIKLWNGQGKFIQSFNLIEKFDYIDISPNGELIVTFSWEEDKQTAKLWKIESEAKQLKPLNNETFNDVIFSEDGKKIATVSGEGEKRTIKLWNGQGKFILQSFNLIEKFDYIDISPNGKLIVTESWEEGKWTAKLWKIEGQKLKPLLADENISEVDFSKDSNKIATVRREGNNRTVKLWKIESEDKQPTRLLRDERINHAATFSEDGDKIATVRREGDKRIVKLWDSQGKLIQSFDPIEKFSWIDFSPNGELIVTHRRNEREPTVTLRKIEGQKLKPLINETFKDVSFSNDGNWIATTNDNFVKLWTQDGEEAQIIDAGAEVEQVNFNAEDKTIATVSADNIVKFWDIDSRDRRILKGKDAEFKIVKLSPTDSKLVVTTYSGEEENQTAQLWSVEGKPIKPLLSQETFNDASFSDNGKFIVTYRREEENQTAQLWSVEGKQIQRLLSQETFNDASFSDNGKFIVTERREEENQTVQLWSVEGKQIQRLLSQETFNDASFSDNGKFIVTERREEEN